MRAGCTRSIGLEKDARRGLERAAECDQLACLREVDPRVVGHQRSAGGVEAEAGELVEAPDARPTQLLGLIGPGLRLDPLCLFHGTSRIDLPGPVRHGPAGSFGRQGRPSSVHFPGHVAECWKGDKG